MDPHVQHHVHNLRMKYEMFIPELPFLPPLRPDETHYCNVLRTDTPLAQQELHILPLRFLCHLMRYAGVWPRWILWSVQAVMFALTSKASNGCDLKGSTHLTLVHAGSAGRPSAPRTLDEESWILARVAV